MDVRMVTDPNEILVEGIEIHGMYLEGAKLNMESNVMEEADYKQLY